MTMTLGIIGHDFAYEMECVLRIFFAGARINIVNENNFTPYENTVITQIERISEHELRLTVKIQFGDYLKESCGEIPAGDDGLSERKLAAMMFTLLSEMTGKSPRWGILTGIRPVRLCEQWRENGLSDGEILARFTGDYLVSPEKAELCIETGMAQEKILALNKPDTFSLYVSIPFCPTRCLYCSFVSHAIDKAQKLVPDYIRLLCEEIGHIGMLARKKGLRLLSIYVGGGTPTTLETVELRQILEAINSSFDLNNLLEYTVEAGRPDTITAEKLEVMRSLGVGRISVNPQSMNDNVLKAIGRPHTSGQAADSMALARAAGFESINMDLIAGLPEETLGSFADSLDKVLDLSPDNVTVHALTVKRSSHLRERGDAFSGVNPDTSGMLDIAVRELRAAGYFPYYLYRQKATVDNLENIGFAKPGREGVYNIYSMEDGHNILAAGAGAVSKLLKNGDITRVFNFKYPYEYISRFDEVLSRKNHSL